nr:hypothetical protein [uncultured Romboutsia sp.]
MAMKKKFLGLALAAAVALPATGVYADTTDTINIGENESRNHQVTVKGSVLGKDGSVPAGRIEVELPTAMQFTVHEDGQLTGVEYTVNNSGSVPVQVLVSSFQKTEGNITLKAEHEINNELDRSNVNLQLNGVVGGQPKSIDLGDLDSEDDKRILTVSNETSGVITLTGTAGKKELKSSSDQQPEGIDKDGTTGKFSLIFKIQKDK